MKQYSLQTVTMRRRQEAKTKMLRFSLVLKRMERSSRFDVLEVESDQDGLEKTRSYHLWIQV